MTLFDDLVRMIDRCHPELTVLVTEGAQELQAQVDAANLPARIKVLNSPFAIPGKLIILNETELRHSMDAALQGPVFPDPTEEQQPYAPPEYQPGSIAYQLRGERP